MAPLAASKGCKCSYADCNQSFEDRDNMVRHKQEEHEYFCLVCNFDGRDWSHTLSHVESPLKAFKCTYYNCAHSYDSEDDMKAHKFSDHPFYCKRCDYDAREWEQQLAHRVEAMAYWLTGPGKDMKKKLFKHIVCEFCGEEFKSIGGRKIHKTGMHPAEQELKCLGEAKVWNTTEQKYITEYCEEIFGRPSQYIRHIEEGRCRFIKRSHVENERQKKQILREIMKDPENFASGLKGNQYLDAKQQKKLARSLIDDVNEDGEDDDEPGAGGIALGLMDTDDASSQCLSIPTLNAYKIPENIMDKREPPQDYPPITDGLPEAMSSLSVASSSTNRSRPSQFLDTIPGMASRASASSVSGTVSQWSTGNASKTLFANSKPPPVERDWAAIQASHDRTKREDEKGNLMFSTAILDPSSADYDASIFRTSITGKFCCPFPECGSEYDIAADISAHLRACHLAVQKTCPLCRKPYRNLTALMQHFESSSRGGRCAISRSSLYKKAIDDATGGFLSATEVAESPVHSPDSNGVKSHDYTATLPPTFNNW